MNDFKINEIPAHPLALFRNHLEFYGYRVEEDEEDPVLICHHPRKYNLIIRAVEDRGVLVSGLYTVREGARRLELLEYINRLNGTIVFSKAYVDEDNNFVIETFFEGDYDRTNFALLMDNLDIDMEIVINDEMTGNFVG